MMVDTIALIISLTSRGLYNIHTGFHNDITSNNDVREKKLLLDCKLKWNQVVALQKCPYLSLKAERV